MEGKGILVSNLIDQSLDWNNKLCPDHYKQSNPADWKVKWQEVLDRRDYIKIYGVGRFLIRYYPQVVNRIFGYQGLKSPSYIESQIEIMIVDWVKSGNPMPKLPSVISQLLFGTIQLRITNFIGGQP